MICRDDLPDTPDWSLPPRETEAPTIPPNDLHFGKVKAGA